MNTLRRHTNALALLIFMAGTQSVFAQNIVDWNTTTSNWNSDSNWLGPDGPFKPNFEFDELANISNGGSVTVSSNISPNPGQIVLGRMEGETGSLIIENGGTLSTSFQTGNVTNGSIDVGGSGTGSLVVQPGGSLSGRFLIVGGVDGSNLTIGASAGSAANLNIDLETTISREVRVVGPNVNFSSPFVNLFSTSTFIPEITSSTHSALNVLNTVAIDSGTLRPEFNGVSPTVGNSWNIIDAAAITGQFVIDNSAAPALPFGQVYSFSVVPDGSSNNGVYGKLAVEQKLVLNVDRNNGSVSIQNGPSPVSINGYAIESALGGLSTGGWNSMQNQGVSNWRESPPGGTANALAELKPTGTTTILAASPVALGSAFQLPTPTEFGTELEDITFEYYSQGGAVTQGIVNYIGDKQYNNLVLVVDPDSGKAKMENQSALSVDIEAYRITSESGSLLFANGQWNSLDDQDAAGGDWGEASPSANQLAELKFGGSTTLSNSTSFDLGTLFKTISAGGTEDLAFEYLFSDESQFRDGVVTYRNIVDPVADFDNDGDVDGTDLGIWQAAYGSTAAGDSDGDSDSDGTDFLNWQRQFNPAGLSAVSAVPEPTTMMLLIGMAAPLTLLSRRRTVAVV